MDNPGQLPQGHRADNSARFTFPGNHWETKGTKRKTANKPVRSFRQFPAEKGQTLTAPDPDSTPMSAKRLPWFSRPASLPRYSRPFC